VIVYKGNRYGGMVGEKERRSYRGRNLLDGGSKI